MNNIKSLWEWISNDFYKNLIPNLDEASSILIGYPILRQLRVKKGILFYSML